MKRLLDSNICIAFMNGSDTRVRDQLRRHAPGDVVLCSIVKAELIYGARKSERVQHNFTRLADFFRTFSSLPFDDLAAEQYGLLRAQLEAVGTPISANDMMIAATALAADVTLVTRNQREFQRVPGLAVEVW